MKNTTGCSLGFSLMAGLILCIFTMASMAEEKNHKIFRISGVFHNSDISIDSDRTTIASQGDAQFDGDGGSFGIAVHFNPYVGVEAGYMEIDGSDSVRSEQNRAYFYDYDYKLDGYYGAITIDIPLPIGFFVRGKVGAMDANSQLTVHYTRPGDPVSFDDLFEWNFWFGDDRDPGSRKEIVNNSWSGVSPMAGVEAGYVLGRGRKIATEFVVGVNGVAVEDVNLTSFHTGVSLRF